MLRPGVREHEIVAMAMQRLFELGSEQVEAINAVSGDRCNPHPHVFSDRLLRPGDQAFFDVIHSFMGYRTCYYRTFNVGGVTQSQIDAYKQCREWLDNAIELVRPGTTTDQIAAVWPTAQELGFPDEQACFGLQFGHGLGVGLYEAPMISRVHSLEHPIEIEEGMVFALETYCAASDGESAARIEEEVVVTSTGTASSRSSPPTSCSSAARPTCAAPTCSSASPRLSEHVRGIEMGRVQDRVVIVTGGAGGIGAATCQAVAAEGAKVVVADLDASAAQAVADAIVASGGTAVSVGVDVTDRVQVQAMVQKAVDSFGALNVIFNNAGMNRPRNFMDIDEENFESIVRVNAWGVIVCTQEAAKQMIAQGSGGKIINTGSIAGRQGFWDFVPYCVAKFGVRRHHPGDGPRPHRARHHRQRVRARRRRHARCGSASTRTSARSTPSPRNRTRCASSQPARSWDAPPHQRELTPFLVYLASPESDYMTGQMYMVDGGQVLV